MPTPSDHVAEQSAPAHERQTSRSRIASCPPEEERLHSAPQEDQVDRNDTPQPQSLPPAQITEQLSTESLSFVRRMASQLAAESDVQAGASSSLPIPVERSKAEHIEDASTAGEAPSPTMGSTPEATSDNDARLAQSMSATAISLPAPSPEYLFFPDGDKDRTKSTSSTTSFLRPGSKFRGTQQSDRQVYDVQVEIKDVDLAESFLCGYLRIQGLTDDHPTLTTFFEGEIIGPKYLFKTGHASWNSSEKIDMQHWARFPAWRSLAKVAKLPNLSLKNFQQREHLFMRWKEYFLVPDHRVKTITGASFEGFYYICFNQCSGSVSGIYFHAKSEKYQQLELKHVDDRGCLPAVEFR